MIAPISFYIHCHNYHWNSLLSQFIDMYMIISVSLMLYDLCVCLIVCSFTFIIVYGSILRQIYEKLKIIVFKHKRRLVVRKQNHMKIRYKLIRSHHEHVHFLSHIFYINKKLISPLMYIGTINILTLSTYLIVFLWFHKMSPHFKKVLIFFWVCQMIFLLLLYGILFN